MKTSNIVWSIVGLIIILGGFYYFTMTPSSTESVMSPSTNLGLNGSQNQTNTGQESVTPVLNVSSSTNLGSFLIASNGMTLYTYAKDTKNVSNCTDVCAANWPPYTPFANEPLLAGTGVNGQLSTITRTDGTDQLTYNGKPLYFWKNDAKPGDTTGQGFGGIWYVLKP